MLPEVVFKIRRYMETLTSQTWTNVLDLFHASFQNRTCIFENGGYLVLQNFASPDSAHCSTSAEALSFVTPPLCPQSKIAGSSELPLSNTPQIPF